VTLRLNGDGTLAIAANGSFEFSDKLIANQSYNVDIVSQPARANCVLANPSDTIDRNASPVKNVTVTCTQAFAVGGIVQGLPTGTSVVLVNTASTGVDSVTLAGNGPFSFPQRADRRDLRHHRQPAADRPPARSPRSRAAPWRRST
jgi:hypothetical protein